MFTGIIEEIGEILGSRVKGQGSRVEVKTSLIPKIKTGDSVAVDGVCLTVTKLSSESFYADVSSETLKKTKLSSAKAKDKVNLELAMTPEGRFGGHLVNGHVDGVGRVKRIPRISRTSGDIEVALVRELMNYVVKKGSIAIDGISLTVVDVLKDGFTVSVIPETLKRTTLGLRKVGDKVNIEVDMLMKGRETRDEGRRTKDEGIVSEDLLKKSGFMK